MANKSVSTDKSEMELEQSDLLEDSDVIGFLRDPVSDRPRLFRHTTYGRSLADIRVDG